MVGLATSLLIRSFDLGVRKVSSACEGVGSGGTLQGLFLCGCHVHFRDLLVVLGAAFGTSGGDLRPGEVDGTASEIGDREERDLEELVSEGPSLVTPWHLIERGTAETGGFGGRGWRRIGVGRHSLARFFCGSVISVSHFDL